MLPRTPPYPPGRDVKSEQEDVNDWSVGEAWWQEDWDDHEQGGWSAWDAQYSSDDDDDDADNADEQKDRDAGTEEPKAKSTAASSDTKPDAATLDRIKAELKQETLNEMKHVAAAQIKAELGRPSSDVQIKREPAAWAVKQRGEATDTVDNAKGHIAQNFREQVRPGYAWVTDEGEKVWTSNETGETFMSLYVCYQ